MTLSAPHRERNGRGQITGQATARFVRPWYAPAQPSRLHGEPLAARRERIVQLWNEGRTMQEIADDVGIVIEVAFRHARLLRREGRIHGHRPQWANQARNRQAAE